MKKHSSLSMIIAAMTICFAALTNAQLIAQSNEKTNLPYFGHVKENPQSIETAACLYNSADALQWILNRGFSNNSGKFISFRDNPRDFQYYNGLWKGALTNVVNIKPNSATIIIDSRDYDRTHIYCQPAKGTTGVKLFEKKSIGYYRMIR